MCSKSFFWFLPLPPKLPYVLPPKNGWAIFRTFQAQPSRRRQEFAHIAHPHVWREYDYPAWIQSPRPSRASHWHSAENVAKPGKSNGANMENSKKSWDARGVAMLNLEYASIKNWDLKRLDVQKVRIIPSFISIHPASSPQENEKGRPETSLISESKSLRRQMPSTNILQNIKLLTLPQSN